MNARFILVLVLLVAAASADTLIEYDTSNLGSGFALFGTYGGSYYDSDQQFTVDAGECFDKISIYYKTGAGAPTGDIYVRIETTGAGQHPTGTLVKAGAWNVSAGVLSGSYQWQNFTLGTRVCEPADITAATAYGLRVNATTQATGVYWFWGIDNADTYRTTKFISESPAGANNTGFDYNFQIWDTGGGANDTQTVNITHFHNGGLYYNGSHFNAPLNMSIRSNSALDQYSIAVFTKNVSGSYSLFNNLTTGFSNSTEQNTTVNWKGTSENKSVCVYALLTSGNGSVAYSNTTDCSQMFFWDDVNPTVSITTPAFDGINYERGSYIPLNATFNDLNLFNASYWNYYAVNGTNITEKYQNFAAGNTTGYFNEVLPKWGVHSGTVRVDACDSHTDAAWSADSIAKDNKSATITKGKDSVTWVIGSQPTTTESRDRVKLSWSRVADAAGVIDYSITVLSKQAITILGPTGYAGHLVTGMAWVDFQDLASAGYKITVLRINSTAVSVRVYQDKLKANTVYLQDPAQGGLNCVYADRGYDVVNYTTTVALTESGTHIAGDTETLYARYNYTNGTGITGASCNYVLDPPAGGNLTGAMNEAGGYNYSFEPTMTGTWDAYVTCNATDHDSHTAHTSFTLTAQPTTLQVYEPASGTFNINDGMTVQVAYNYSNGTFITGAACNATVHQPTGGNVTSALGETAVDYTGGFFLLELGVTDWSVECAASGAAFKTGNGALTVYPLNSSMSAGIAGVFSIGENLTFFSNYSYLNGTYLPAATCNLTVLDPILVNTTFVMPDLGWQ